MQGFTHATIGHGDLFSLFLWNAEEPSHAVEDSTTHNQFAVYVSPVSLLIGHLNLGTAFAPLHGLDIGLRGAEDCR